MKKKNIFLYFLLARDHESNITENVIKKINSKNIKHKKCIHSLLYKDIIHDEHYLLYEKWYVSSVDEGVLLNQETLKHLSDELLENNILKTVIWNELYTTKGFDTIDRHKGNVVSISEASLKSDAISGLFDLFETLISNIKKYKGILGCSLSIPNEGELDYVLLKIIWKSAELREEAINDPSFIALKGKLSKYINGNINIMLFKEV
ncbi:hypothetical protein AAEX28_03665 [Lentisphaerota bacterium WC36G]|nr:hypothetical protein LJT99_06540 [Lentisphaerae bacterium WC36]